ncbi:MAG: hypothetical protein AAGE80_05465 [Pseudomonadota bacterium]
MEITHKERVEMDVSLHPKVWEEGYKAYLAGKKASACPYAPIQESQVNAWLSGHVTARDVRAQKIWQKTHPDYRGENAEGELAILVLRNGGTTSVPVSSLTDDEMERLDPREVPA